MPGEDYQHRPCVAHTQPNSYFTTRGGNRADRNYRDYVTLKFTQDVVREISAILTGMLN